MTELPLVCPSCAAFVRSDWHHTCGVCGAPLIESSDVVAQTAPTEVTKPKRNRVLVGAIAGAVALSLLGGTAYALASATSSPVVSSAARSNDPLDATTTTTNTTTAPPDFKSLTHSFASGASSGFFTPTTRPAPATAGPVAQDASVDGLLNMGWTPASSSACHCTADFPWTPEQQSSSTDGASFQMVLSSNPTSPFAFGIISTDAASGTQLGTADLKVILGDAASGMGGTVSNETVSNNLGMVVVDANIRMSDGSAMADAFQRNGTVYTLMVVTTASTDVTPLFHRFTSTFRVSGA